MAGHPRERIEADATAALQAGFQVDCALRTPELAEPTFDGGGRVALIAARLGTTRLIDNLNSELRRRCAMHGVRCLFQGKGFDPVSPPT